MKAIMESCSVVWEAVDFWKVEAEISTIRAIYILDIEASVFEINVELSRSIVAKDKWFIEAWLLNMLRTHFRYEGSSTLYYHDMSIRIKLG